MHQYTAIVSLANAAQTAIAEQRQEQARVLYSRALRIAYDLHRFRLMAVLFDRLGQMFERQGEIQDATIAYESGLKILSADSDLTFAPIVSRLRTVSQAAGAQAGDLEAVLVQLGAVSKEYGDYRQIPTPDLYSAPTDQDLQQAERDPFLAVRLLINVGGAYLRQPQEEPALNAYLLALQRPESAQAPHLRAYALANSGEIHRRQGQIAQAAAELAEATALFDQAGDPLEKRRALALQAGIARDQGQTAHALTLYQQALALYAQTADPLGEGRTYAGLGHLHRQQQEFVEAEAAYTQALALATALDDKDTLWHVYWGLGSCQQVAGRLDAAAASLRASIRLIDARQQDLRTDEGKVTFLDNVREVFDQLIVVHLSRTQTDASAYTDALAVAEEARGRALRDLLGDRTRCRPGFATEVIHAVLEADNEVAVDFNPVAQMAPGAFSPPRIEATAPTPRGQASAPLETPTRPPLARLVFHLLSDQTAIFAATSDGNVYGHVLHQGRADLTTRIAQLRKSLAVDDNPRGVSLTRHLVPIAGGEGSADPAPLLRNLYSDLIAPIADKLPADGNLLVIEPHDTLWLLPFAALMDENDHWLADRWPLLYSPSAQVLDEIRAEPDAGDPTTLKALIVGNPVMPAVPPQNGLEVTLAPLPGAEQEARAVAALFAESQRTLLLGAAADLATVESQAQQHGILHLATHGIAYGEDPLASFVALAATADRDGLLTARRTLDLQLPVDLVTLSACQTGLGRLSGDGMIGLSRAFLITGARAVLVSQWSVNDEATALLMETFYRHYLAHDNKAQALQRAMQGVRALPAYAHPRNWAAFVVIGAEA